MRDVDLKILNRLTRTRPMLIQKGGLGGLAATYHGHCRDIQLIAIIMSALLVAGIYILIRAAVLFAGVGWTANPWLAVILFSLAAFGILFGFSGARWAFAELTVKLALVIDGRVCRLNGSRCGKYYEHAWNDRDSVSIVVSSCPQLQSNKWWLAHLVVSSGNCECVEMIIKISGDDSLKKSYDALLEALSTIGEVRVTGSLASRSQADSQ